MRFNLSLVVLLALFCHSCISSGFLPYNCPVAECIYSGNTNASSAIICNSCTLKLISNSDKAARLYQFRQKLTNEDVIGYTRLVDLNADVLMLIYDELDLLDMTNLLSAYPSKMLLTVARDSFRIRYKDYTISIDDRSRTDRIYCDVDRKNLQVSSQIDSIFRFFGVFFRDLEVMHPSTHISHLINKYTTESLIKLGLPPFENDTLTFFTKPFQFVEELSLHSRIDSARMPLNQLFPSIRRFILRLYTDENMSLLLCEYPHLEHFDSHNLYQPTNETIFGEFFRRNPQIRNLRMTKLTDTLCSIINEHLQVENLTTLSHGFRIEHKTTFAHVKFFRFQISGVTDIISSIGLLDFPILEHLRIEFSQDSTDIWKTFYKKHKHLNHLEIINVYSDNYDQLIQVTEELNLTEITLRHLANPGYAIDADIINKIIERGEKLMRLNLWGFYLSKDQVEMLRKKFESDWNIIEHGHSNEEQIWDLSFEKKN